MAITDMQQAKAADFADLVYEAHTRLARIKRKNEYAADRERLREHLAALQKMLPHGKFPAWAQKEFHLEQEALFAYMRAPKENA